MFFYWIRHRALLSIILSSLIAILVGSLFMFPFISQMAVNHNSQSIYKNSSIDFIAPEPSFEQCDQLTGTNGIDKLFPYFYTSAQVKTKDRTRTTNVLLSDEFENLDITMYNSKRLIRQSDAECDNPVLVDWQFCKDTSADLGDTISFSIGDTNVEYKIAAIYETNSIYDKGAILIKLNSEQKKQIEQKSLSNGYSGMYIMASDYNTCKSYLTTDYRPLGKLKKRELFKSDEQYQIHYDAVMSSEYANEITDFRARESSFDKEPSPLMVYIGAALSAVLILLVNAVLANRGCENNYFTKHCIPKGIRVKPYYSRSFFIEILCFITGYAGILIYLYKSSAILIPKPAYERVETAYIVGAFILAELLCLFINNSRIKSNTKASRSSKNSQPRVNDTFHSKACNQILSIIINKRYENGFTIDDLCKEDKLVPCFTKDELKDAIAELKQKKYLLDVNNDDKRNIHSYKVNAKKIANQNK